MAKRGLVIEAVNFFSHPYTSERAKEKVLELAKILSGFTGKVRVHIVPFTEIQLAIRDLCPEEYLTLIMRRIMMRIAQQLAEENHCKALITGAVSYTHLIVGKRIRRKIWRFTIMSLIYPLHKFSFLNCLHKEKAFCPYFLFGQKASAFL